MCFRIVIYCTQYNILLLMFENNMEKGLFTFYWEEAQKQKKNDGRETIQKQKNQTKNKANKKVKVKIEEKQQLSLRNQRNTISKIMKLGLSQMHSAPPTQKQNRQYLLPNSLDISSKLTQSLKLHQSKSGSFLSQQNNQKQQFIRKLPQVKSTLQRAQSQNEAKHSTSSFVQKLNRQDQNTSIRKSANKIQEQHTKPSKAQKIFFLRNTKQMNTLWSKRQSINKNMYGDSLISALKKKSKILRELPVLSNTTLHKRAPKDAENLQKMLMERMQATSGYSSVIKIGIQSCDQYMQRWQRRKQQFLQLLAKNMQSQILRE